MKLRNTRRIVSNIVISRHVDEFLPIFRHFNPPDKRREAWWAVTEPPLEDETGYTSAIVLGLIAVNAQTAVDDGHTDEYVGYVYYTRIAGPGNRRDAKTVLFGGAGWDYTVCSGSSLKTAMRALEAAWVLGMTAEKFKGVSS